MGALAQVVHQAETTKQQAQSLKSAPAVSVLTSADASVGKIKARRQRAFAHTDHHADDAE